MCRVVRVTSFCFSVPNYVNHMQTATELILSAPFPIFQSSGADLNRRAAVSPLQTTGFDSEDAEDFAREDYFSAWNKNQVLNLRESVNG